jgi:hypothetical protein
MTSDEPKRKWFEEVPIRPTFSHARTKPLVVEKVKKRAQAGDDSSATERNDRSDTNHSNE